MRNSFNVSGNPRPRVLISVGLCLSFDGEDIVEDYVGNMLVSQCNVNYCYISMTK